MDNKEKNQQVGASLVSEEQKKDIPPSPFAPQNKDTAQVAAPSQAQPDIKVETMPADKAQKPKKKRTSLKILIPLLVVLILGLSAVAIWLYRDSLGLDKYFPSLFSKEEAEEGSVTPTTQNTTPSSVTSESIKSDLETRVEALEKIQDEYAKKKDLNVVIGFLKITDTDGDGISDYEEIVIYTTNPDKADTDEDGYSDKDEIENGFNPNGEGELKIEAEEEVEVIEEPSGNGEPASIKKEDIIGNYTGLFSLTDIDLSAKDVKFSLGHDNKVSGSYTFLYEENTYRTEFAGIAEVDVEKNEITLSSDAKTIVGTSEDEHKIDLFLTFNPSKQELSGVIELKDGEAEFLKEQKGEIEIKRLSNGLTVLPPLPN